MNDFEQVKERTSLTDYANRYLTSRGRGVYNCPACGSGTGPSKTAAFRVNGDRWTCWACNQSGDVFDLAGIIHNTSDRREQLQIIADWAGIPLEGDRPKVSGTVPKPRKPEPVKDYTQGREAEAAKVRAWQANIEDPAAVSYLQGRGFTLEQAKAWGLGYDPSRKRVTIPYPGADYYHIDRDVTGSAKAKYLKPDSDAVGPEPVWNRKAAHEPVYFIVEGPLDALAVESCGYPAMALGSSRSDSVERHIIATGASGCAVVALDNDSNPSKGPEHQGSMLERLTAANICAVGAVYPDGWPKDFAEAYEADTGKLRAFLSDLEAKAKEARAEADELAKKEAEEAYREACSHLQLKSPADLAEECLVLRSMGDPIPTGFPALDRVLGDGLQPGSLYVIGAISSLGKTTLAVQIADRIAANGHPVLFVTIEQRAREIAAKSLSRIARGYDYPACTADPITAADISNRRRRGEWSEGKTEALGMACVDYAQQIGPFLQIMEANGQPTVRDIRTAASMIAGHDGKTPVVFIDYLQLLAGQNERDTDKQNTDRNVMDLRQLAGDLQTPVFAISSLNRGSYNGSISMEAFKESGAIEYGADVLMGLQPYEMDRVEGSDDKAKSKAKELNRKTKGERYRDVALAVLKNRNGSIADGEKAIRFTYDCWTNHFEER